MQRDFASAIADHQLRREIIATKIANRIINRMGIVHPFELVEEEGCALGDIAAAFVAVERLLDMPAIWDALDDAKIDESVSSVTLRAGVVGHDVPNGRPASRHADAVATGPGRRTPSSPGSTGWTAGVDALLSPSVKRQWAHAGAAIASTRARLRNADLFGRPPVQDRRRDRHRRPRRTARRRRDRGDARLHISAKRWGSTGRRRWRRI